MEAEMTPSKDQIDQFRDSLDELKGNQKSNAIEARQAVGAVQLQLNGVILDVALMKGAIGELPQIRVSLDDLRDQATRASTERRTERSLAKGVWVGVMGLIGALSSLITYLLTKHL